MRKNIQKIAYTRLSPNENNPENKIKNMFEGKEYDELCIDCVPVNSTTYPQRDKLIDSLKSGDEVIIFSLNKLGSTLTSIQFELQKILEKKAKVIVLQDGITISCDIEDNIPFLWAVKMANITSAHLQREADKEE